MGQNQSRPDDDLRSRARSNRSNPQWVESSWWHTANANGDTASFYELFGFRVPNPPTTVPTDLRFTTYVTVTTSTTTSASASASLSDTRSDTRSSHVCESPHIVDYGSVTLSVGAWLDMMVGKRRC